MPICSYIVHPEPGQLEALTAELNVLPHCEATPAEQHEILVLVTETRDETEERHLRHMLNRHRLIRNITLTFGEIEPAREKETIDDCAAADPT